MTSAHSPYPCKYKDVGCPVLLPPAAMARHLDEDAKSHLRLVIRALRVEQNDNNLCKEAMTCAQSRCRKIEFQNAELRERIDAIKSRLETIQLQPAHHDLYERLLEMDPEAMELCVRLYKEALLKSKEKREAAFPGEAELMAKLRSKLAELESENAKARTELLKLTDQLRKKRGEEKSTTDVAEEAAPSAQAASVYVMGIPIAMHDKPRYPASEVNSIKPLNPSFTMGLFRRFFTALDGAWFVKL
uniref:Uncharacterized protein n=1 Tax=Lotharella globosa TaxID=91324 RepID=A0A7S3ZIK8_9EUKA